MTTTFKRTRSIADAPKRKKHGTQAEGLHSSKDPRYNLKPIATAMEDILHVYCGHDGGSSSSEAADQLCSLCLAGVIQKPRCHLMEVPAGAKLQGGKSDASPLSNFSHHRAFTVLHQNNLLEAGLLHLMAGSH
jgi:hypothetical protein